MPYPESFAYWERRFSDDSNAWRFFNSVSCISRHESFAEHMFLDLTPLVLPDCILGVALVWPLVMVIRSPLFSLRRTLLSRRILGTQEIQTTMNPQLISAKAQKHTEPIL